MVELAKASPIQDTVDFILDLLLHISPRFRKVFEEFLEKIGNLEVAQEVVDNYRNQDWQTNLTDFLRDHGFDIWDAWKDFFHHSGKLWAHRIELQIRSDFDKWEAGKVPPRLNQLNILAGRPPADMTLQFRFNPGHRTATKIMHDAQLRLIKDITESQRDLVRAVLEKALREGRNPLDAARELKKFLGLTRNQWQAVENYKKSLENASRDALERSLRDKRFDATVSNAIENDEPLTASQIERMVGRYTQRMKRYRAETVARTEMMRAVSQARQSSWHQLLDQVGGQPHDVVKTWIATLDDRVRDTHEEMHMQKVIGIDNPYRSPTGEAIYYPGDPDASAEEIINCRCTETMMIWSYKK